MYLRTKFQVSSIILTSFRQVDEGNSPPSPAPPPPPYSTISKQNLKKPTQIVVNYGNIELTFCSRIRKTYLTLLCVIPCFSEFICKKNNKMKASVLPEVTQNDLSGLLVNLTSKTTICSASLCALNNKKSSLKFPLVLITKHLFSLFTKCYIWATSQP